MSVFVDTSAVYALFDRDDARHAEARQLWDRLFRSRERLVTSNYVLLESAALLQSRLGLEAMKLLLNDLEPELAVHWISAEDHRAAVLAMVSANSRRLSLVDCSSFLLMRQLGVQVAFAFDRHFADHGFELLGGA